MTASLYADSFPATPAFTPASDRTLPVVERQAETSRYHLFGQAVLVKEFVFNGNRRISSARLKAATDDYVGHSLTFEDLVQIRDQLNLLYVNAGYVTSGVSLPTSINNGVVTFSVTEGVVGALSITGEDRLPTTYIAQQIEIQPGDVINLAELEETLKLAQLDPLISSFNVRLEPSSLIGVSDLYVEIEEADVSALEVIAGNLVSPAVGAEAIQVSFRHQNLTGNADNLRLGYQKAEGLDELDFSYLSPQVWRGLRGGLHYHESRANAQEAPFSDLDIESEVRSYGASIEYARRMSPSSDFSLGLQYERRKSESFLLGRGFSFSPGSDEGLARVDALRFEQRYTHRNENRVWALRSTLSFGLNRFDGLSQGLEPDGRFVSWLGQVQLAKRLDMLSSLLLIKADLQLASNPLPGMEQFALGGMNTIRGYRENQLAGDGGWLMSTELRIPVTGNRGANLDAMVFLDAGRVENKGRATPVDKHLGSVGIGLRVRFWGRTEFEVWVAEALRTVPDSSDEHDLQDDGVHFRLRSVF